MARLNGAARRGRWRERGFGHAVLAGTVAVVLLVWALPAGAIRCPRSDLLEEASLAIGREADCIHEIDRGDGPGQCSTLPGPACAEATRNLLRTLAFGDPAGWRPALRLAAPDVRECQRSLGTVSGRLAAHRLDERAAGQRRSRGGRLARGIARACDGVVVQEVQGQLFPSVGGVCHRLAAEAGSVIEGPRLARCIRSSIEGLVDDVSPEPLRPNIVLILTDDQRADSLAFMPATLDRLASRGLVFENAFATTPACSPSRASFYTGLQARRHGVIANGFEPALEPAETLVPALARAGYATGFFGKYLNGSEDLSSTDLADWERWSIFLEPSGGSYFGSRIRRSRSVADSGADHYSTDLLGREALRFVRARLGRPFFTVFAPYAPHAPSTPAPRHEGRFADLPPHRPPSWRESDVSDKPPWVRLFARSASDEGVALLDQRRRAELETLLAVDEFVMALDATLERYGLADQTIVVFVSDHGIHWGEHWSPQKFSAYEESIRIPWVLRHPARIPLAATTGQLVTNLDLAPTLLELAGAEALAGIDGRSLVPVIESAFDPDAPPWRREIAIESWGGTVTSASRALRTVRWKYIETEAGEGVFTELYNLRDDPFEMENLAGSPSLQVTRERFAERLEAALPRAGHREAVDAFRSPSTAQGARASVQGGFQLDKESAQPDSDR